MTTLDERRARRSGGPMMELSAAERRERQEQVLTAPSRRYGIDARTIFWLEDRVWGPTRTLSKFKARELVALAPYRAWVRQHADPQADRDEADNERCHREVLAALIEEDGAREDPIRFGLAPYVGVTAMYVFTLIQHRMNPSRSYRLNADIEDHAADEYARLVQEHPEWEQLPYQPVVDGYGEYESRADVLRQMGCDESAHKARSVALASSTDDDGRVE